MLPRLIDAFVDPVMGAISDRTRSPYGCRRIYLLVGSILLGVSFGAIFLIPPDLLLGPRVALVMTIFLLSNLSVSLFEAPYSAMLAEMTADYGERTVLTGYKMMAARIGIILTAFVGPLIFRSTPDLNDGFRLLGLVAGAFLISLALAGFGFVQGAGPDAQSAEALFGIRAIYTGVPLGLWLAAIVVLMRYNLTEARFNALKAEILARQNAPES